MFWRQDPSSSIGVVTLPTGVMVDDQLVTEVQVREISGEEEDLLTAPSIPGAEKIQRVIENCCLAIGHVEDRGLFRKILLDMSSGDRLALLLGLRAISLGPTFPMIVSCPECKHESKISVDLSEQEARPANPEAISFLCEFRPGAPIRKVRWQPMTGRMEIARAKIDSDLRRDNLITVSMATRIIEVDDKPIDPMNKMQMKALVAALKRLPSRDRETLREHIKANEGGIDSDVEWACEECGRENKSMVDVTSVGFFFPSGT